MSLWIRRIIFYGILIIFTIAAPLIILYTAGYRYNFKQGKFLKTGAIIITTDPKEALVFLNDRLRKEKTPARLLNLTPGDYNLRVTKPGYFSWSKTLKVESEQATFVNNLTLFKEPTPKLIVPGDIIDVIQAPSEDKSVYLKRDKELYELWLWNNSEQPRLIWRGIFASAPKFIKWSHKNNEILIQSNDWFLLQLNKEVPQLKNLRILTGKKWTNIIMNKLSGIVFGTSGKNLYSVNTESGNADLLEQKVHDFDFIDGETVLLQENDNNLTLKTLKNNQDKEIASLLGSDYEFRESSLPWIVLYNQKTHSLEIISKDNGQLANVDGEKTAWFDKGEHHLLSYSDFEIWHNDPAKNQQELLSRFSQKIDYVFAHPSGNAFIFITDNSVKAAERDLRGQQNVYTLATFDKIHQTRIDSAGKTLLIAGVKEKTAGLWRLEIK